MKKTLKLIIMVLALMLAVPTVATYADNSIITVEAKTKKKSKKKKKAKTTTITIKKESDIASAVTKVHSTALKHKPITLKIKGNKKKSVKLLEKFEKQLQQYNTYSVIINVERDKTIKGYTPYEISKEDTLTYDYACQYIQKCINLKKAEYDKEQANFIKVSNKISGTRKYNTSVPNLSRLMNMTEPYAVLSPATGSWTQIILPPESYTGTWIDYWNEDCLPEYRIDATTPTQTFAEYYKLQSDWKYYCPELLLFEDGYTFAQLSTLQQQIMLPGVAYNGTLNTRDYASGSTSQKLKKMITGTTTSMCYECAKYQIAIEEQLDIPTKYYAVQNDEANHAYMFVYVESKGNSCWQSWNNGKYQYTFSEIDRIGVVREFNFTNSGNKGTPTSTPKGHTYLH